MIKDTACRESLIANREEKLWTRMEQLLDREAQLRDDEREAARRREMHLQSQVDMLLSVVSQNQTERSLPPSASPSQLVQSQTGSTPQARDLGSDQGGAAHQSHGTFDEANEDPLPSDVRSALDAVDSASSKASGSPEQPAPRSDVQDVINAVLSGNVDPLEDDFFSQYAGEANQPADTTSDAASPAPAAQPAAAAASSTAEPPTASAQGGAIPPHVAAALDESRDALQTQEQASGKGAPIEHQKADPDGPPPVLNAGDDDIYWVGRLHVRFRFLLQQHLPFCIMKTGFLALVSSRTPNNFPCTHV